MTLGAAAELKRITLTLARSKEFPDGSKQFGYEFIAPVDQSGHIDVAVWKSKRADCVVRHFSAGQEGDTGMLVHKAGGKKGRWVFDYDFSQKSDDEAGFHFEDHVFLPGEYVSICDARGTTHTFAVESVKTIT